MSRQSRYRHTRSLRDIHIYWKEQLCRNSVDTSMTLPLVRMSPCTVSQSDPVSQTALASSRNVRWRSRLLLSLVTVAAACLGKLSVTFTAARCRALTLPVMELRSDARSFRTLAAQSETGQSFDELAGADTLLASWDAQDRANRRAGGYPWGALPPGQIEDVVRLRSAVKVLANGALSLRLGVMAENGREGVQALKSWTAALQCPLQGIVTMDANNTVVNKEQIANEPVYIKYQCGGSAVRGDSDKLIAYMKPHIGPTRGVTINPDCPDGEFRMYGDFPLALFSEDDK